MFRTYEKVYVTAGKLLHILVCAGDDRISGGGWIWFFLYWKHFPFTWDRATFGNGCSEIQFFLQAERHTVLPDIPGGTSSLQKSPVYFWFRRPACIACGCIKATSVCVAPCPVSHQLASGERRYLRCQQAYAT